MMKKASGLALPKAEKYEWTGPYHWNKFLKGDKSFNLMTITDAQIEQLLKDDPKYWNQKFKAVAPAKLDKGDS